MKNAGNFDFNCDRRIANEAGAQFGAISAASPAGVRPRAGRAISGIRRAAASIA